MNLLPTTAIALRALAKNKMRASLTVLGIVIGVAAVTTLVSLGQGASSVVQGQLKALGTNLIIVASASVQDGPVRGGRGGTPTLTVDDALAMATQCPTLAAVTPVVGAPSQVIYRNNNWMPQELLGVGRDFLAVKNWDLRVGGFFTDQEIRGNAKVCVIGQTVVAKLFQTTDPLHESIRIHNIPFEVVGVLESKGTSFFGGDQDDVILAPYTTVRSRLKGASSDKVDAIFCSVRSESQMDEAAYDIEQLFRQRHRIREGDPADFEVKNIKQIASLAAKLATAMTVLLSCIAGIALVVGGVGIMNIMLVSVTERTREIGIRMAVGARQKDIMLQFLNEAVVLSTLGGLVGLALGIAASLGIVFLINVWMPDARWETNVPWRESVVAIAFAVAIGVFSGYYPARRASQLDPIECLRYE